MNSLRSQRNETIKGKVKSEEEKKKLSSRCGLFLSCRKGRKKEIPLHFNAFQMVM